MISVVYGQIIVELSVFPIRKRYIIISFFVHQKENLWSKVSMIIKDFILNDIELYIMLSFDGSQMSVDGSQKARSLKNSGK